MSAATKECFKQMENVIHPLHDLPYIPSAVKALYSFGMIRKHRFSQILYQITPFADGHDEKYVVWECSFIQEI